MRYPPPPEDWIIRPDDEFSTFLVVTDLALTAEVLVQVSRSAKLDGCFKIQLGGDENVKAEFYPKVIGDKKSRKKSCLPQSRPEEKILHRGRFGFIALLQSVGYHSPKLLGGGKRPQRKHGETPLCISGLRHLEQVQIRMEHF